MTDFDDFGLLADMARRELIHLLEQMSEVKDLVVDPTLMRPLDKIASMSLLAQHNCACVQQLTMDGNIGWSEQSFRRLYLVRKSVAIAKCISEHIRAEPDRQYSVIFVPSKHYLCDLEFEKNGVFGMVDIYEWDLPLINIDSHLFSLEHPTFVSSVLVDRSLTELYCVAKSLWQLQSLYGLIPTIYGIGENSVYANNIMKKLYADLGEPRASPDQPVSHLFLLDRNLDVATVLLTGLTYESMLHDTFTISCGKVVFGDEVELRMKSGSSKSRCKVTVLNNNDPIFSAVRNKHMTAVFPFLSSKAKALQASFDKGSQLNQVNDIKNFVSNELRALKQQHKLLELHICACEVVLENCKGMSDRLTLEHSLITGNCDPNDIMSFLEDKICQQSNLWQILLLVCLWSICQNGLPSKFYHSFRSQFLRAYGYEYLTALHSLAALGLLTERNLQLSMLKPLSMRKQTHAHSRPSLPFISSRMNLVSSTNEGPLDFENPNQMRYVFSGVFTPLLCQIIGGTLTNGWNTAEMKKLFGDSVFCDQNSYTHANRPPDSRVRKAILVYFVGGVTYAEIAALTLLAQHNNLRIIVAATNVIHRNKFIKSMANVTCS